MIMKKAILLPLWGAFVEVLIYSQCTKFGELKANFTYYVWAAVLLGGVVAIATAITLNWTNEKQD